MIAKIYADFLGDPNGHLSHELLHTTYTARGLYNQMTDENFVIDVKQIPETKSTAAQKAVGAIVRARAGTQESSRVTALEAENAILKAELAKHRN